MILRWQGISQTDPFWIHSSHLIFWQALPRQEGNLMLSIHKNTGSDSVLRAYTQRSLCTATGRCTLLRSASLSGAVSLFQDPVLATEWMTLPVVWLGVRLCGLKLCRLALKHRMHLQGQVKCKLPGFSEWFVQQEALASSSGCCTGAKEI